MSVKNTGKTPIKIGGIRTSCGCMIPKWCSNKINPIGESEIRLLYHSKAKGAIGEKKRLYKIWIIINGKEELVTLEIVVHAN